MNNQENWYIIYTYPNREKKVLNELNINNVTAYLPVKKVLRQWSDRKKILEVPLFPNYIFVKIQAKNIWPMQCLNGVAKFIKFGGMPVIVKDEDINIVRKLETGNYQLKNENVYSIGEEVIVKLGPLSGIKGRIIKTKTKARLFIEIETIHQIVSVEIETSLIQHTTS